jgi:hypothetical protein
MKVEDLKFTKELKENWLSALKSGKYIQDSGQLKTQNGHCCLGVLAEIHPDLQITESGQNCLINNGKNDVGYRPFSTLLTEKAYQDIYRENDNSCDKIGIKDFSTVIPLIEKLPTVD